MNGRPSPNPSAGEGNIITCWYKPQIARIHTNSIFGTELTDITDATVPYFKSTVVLRVFSAIRASKKG